MTGRAAAALLCLLIVAGCAGPALRKEAAPGEAVSGKAPSGDAAAVEEAAAGAGAPQPGELTGPPEAAEEVEGEVVGEEVIEAEPRRPPEAASDDAAAVGEPEEEVSQEEVIGFFLKGAFKRLDDDPAAARRIYQKVISMAPANWLAHYNLGMLMMWEGELEGARRELLLALENARRPPSDIYAALGMVHLRLGMTEEAIRYFDDGLGVERSPAMLMNAANAYQEAGRLEEALRNYRKVEAVDPEFRGLDYNLGMLLFRMGHYDGALHRFEQALERDEAPRRTLLLLKARTLLKLGEPAAALQILQRLADDGEDKAAIYRNMGIIYELYMGDMERAARNYELYLAAAGEDDPEVGRWLRLVRARLERAGGGEGPP
ncbi:MAG TPA: tetratricopeptide repeat protein [Deltaproteobacteria bacterium]|nr:tetratricopeptide repeat protein [Deltaproteobacteria bacterium]